MPPKRVSSSSAIGSVKKAKAKQVIDLDSDDPISESEDVENSATASAARFATPKRAAAAKKVVEETPAPVTGDTSKHWKKFDTGTGRKLPFAKNRAEAEAAAKGKKIVSPVAAASSASAAQQGVSQKEKEEDILADFDRDFRWGPCLGMSRASRWWRADKMGLSPPQDVKEILERLGQSFISPDNPKAAAEVHSVFQNSLYTPAD